MQKKVWNIANCNKEEVGALLLDDWEPFAITVGPPKLKAVGADDVATYWLRKQIKVEVEVEQEKWDG